MYTHKILPNLKLFTLPRKHCQIRATSGRWTDEQKGTINGPVIYETDMYLNPVNVTLLIDMLVHVHIRVKYNDNVKFDLISYMSAFKLKLPDYGNNFLTRQKTLLCLTSRTSRLYFRFSVFNPEVRFIISEKKRVGEIRFL